MPCPPRAVTISAVSSIVSGRRVWSHGDTFLAPFLGRRFARVLRPEQYTVAPASPNASAVPRPTPRVAPATSATRPRRSGALWEDGYNAYEEGVSMATSGRSA